MNSTSEILDQKGSQEKAYTYIKASILSLDFGPKRRLLAQEIAQKLDISRTPVREALSRLEQEGLVVRDSGWGYVVKAYGYDEALSLFNVREALELQAIREAVAHMDDRVVGMLESILLQARSFLKSNRMTDFQASNRRFYGLIAQTTRNSILQQFLGMINDRIRILAALAMNRDPRRGVQVMAENKQILDALRTRDLAAAENAVRTHIQRATANVLSCLGDISK
jgi:DNA-binding GntR family transcriptional regulator